MCAYPLFASASQRRASRRYAHPAAMNRDPKATISRADERPAAVDERELPRLLVVFEAQDPLSPLSEPDETHHIELRDTADRRRLVGSASAPLVVHRGLD